MTIIVCVSQNWGIGQDGQTLFRLSADRRRFRELTMGKTLILGPRNLATFPGGKPLPGRRHVLLTRSETYVEGTETAHSPEEAAALAGPDALVVGGASVYTRMLPLCDRVLVTKVEAAPEADSYFPNLDKHPDWRLASESETMEENGLRFRFAEYVRA